MTKQNLSSLCTKIIGISSLAQPEVGAAYVIAGTLNVASRGSNFMILRIESFSKKRPLGGSIRFKLPSSTEKKNPNFFIRKMFFSVENMTSFEKNGQKTSFLDATTHIYKRSCPSVRRSVRPSVPCYFRMTKIEDFDREKR